MSLEFALGWICHQIPERCFLLGGEALPLCARCLGMYGGALLGAIGWLVTRRGGLGWGLLALLAIPIEVGFEHLLPELSGNWIRFLSGLLTGAGAGLLLARGATDSPALAPEPRWAPAHESNPDPNTEIDITKEAPTQ